MYERTLFKFSSSLSKGLNEPNQQLVNRVLDEIGYKMVENTINSTINMTTRDTKDGIADVLSEILSTNRKVRAHIRQLSFQRIYLK
jgi:hypothetical protein